MSWRIARSLATLREQINALSPNRSKVSDGTIGDTAHSSRTSDHNPDAKGIVRGMDLTHDPEHGIVGKAVANALLATRDPRLKYVISDGEIAAGADGPKPWAWRPYTGKNPHRHHVHVSVVAGAAGDDPRPWRFGLNVPLAATLKPVTPPKNPILARGTKGPDVERMQKLIAAARIELLPDSDFGPKTEAALKTFQRRAKLVADGRCGPATWEALEAFSAKIAA